MSKLLRPFAAGAAAMYLLVGMILGTAMASAIPALNWMGTAYYVVTWPAWLLSGTANMKWHPPIASWMFTFPPQPSQSEGE